MVGGSMRRTPPRPGAPASLRRRVGFASASHRRRFLPGKKVFNDASEKA
jgi:hypothetical protein